MTYSFRHRRPRTRRGRCLRLLRARRGPHRRAHGCGCNLRRCLRSWRRPQNSAPAVVDSESRDGPPPVHTVGSTASRAHHRRTLSPHPAAGDPHRATTMAYERGEGREDVSGNTSTRIPPPSPRRRRDPPQCPTFGAPVNLTPHNVTVSRMRRAWRPAGSKPTSSGPTTTMRRQRAPAWSVYALSTVDGHYTRGPTCSQQPEHRLGGHGHGARPGERGGLPHRGAHRRQQRQSAVKDCSFPRPTASATQTPGGVGQRVGTRSPIPERVPQR